MNIIARLSQLSSNLYRFISILLQDILSIPKIGSVILLGGLLWSYSVWLIIPSFLVMGFFIRILRYIPPSSTEADATPRPSSPPKFDQWVRLLFDGIRAYIIWMGYVLIGFGGYISAFSSESNGALFLLIINAVLGNVSFLLDIYTTIGGTVDVPGSVTAGLLIDPAVLGLLLAMYLGPAALLNFAARGTLSDGFSFSELSQILRNLTYVRNWIVFILAWGVGTFILFMPSHSIASTLVSSDYPTIARLIRESIELLRGFLSFAIILIGYTALGRVAVPPQDDLSIGTYLRTRLKSDLAVFIGRSLRSGQPILVAALLASFWSIPSVVLLMGYVSHLVRVNRSAKELTFPSFGSLWSLVVDGLRAVGLWIVYGFPPLVFLYIWNISNSWPHAIIGNFMTGMTAFVIGSWYFGRNIYTIMIEVGMTELLESTIDPRLALAVFGIFSFLIMYLYPAALIFVVHDRKFRSGFSLYRLIKSTWTLTYARAWFQAIVALVFGSALLLAWNYWRLLPARASIRDTVSLLSIRGYSLITFPTEVGILSSLFLFMTGMGNVLLLFWAYYKLSKAIPDLEESELQEF